MSDDSQSAATTLGSIEQRFLDALKTPPLQVAELLDLLNTLHAGEPSDRLESFALVLEDTLAKEGELEGLIGLFEMRLEWVDAIVRKTAQAAAKDKANKDAAKQAEEARNTATAFIGHIREALNVAARKKRLHVALVDSISLGKPGVQPSESLRRLRVLLQCRPGAHCLDKTWGFGTIVRQDEFYRRLTIDFDRKKGHALAFGYAGESLKLIGADHILTEFHAGPAAFYERVRKTPGEVVLHALRSFGPMSVTRMEDEFAAYHLLPPAEGYVPAAKGKAGDKTRKPTQADAWKHFWTQARAELKNNPTVSIPPTTKKNDPIVLLVKAIAFGDETWYQRLSRETDVSAILSQAAAVAAKSEPGTLPEANAAILADRLQYAYRAAQTRTQVSTPAMEITGDIAVSNESRYKRWQDGVRQGCADMARALLLANAMKLPGIPVEDWVREMATPDFLSKASMKVSARDLASLVALIPVKDDAAAAEPFANAILSLPFALVDVMLPDLLRGVAAAPVRARIAEAFGNSDVPFPILLWMARHQNEEDIRTIVQPAAIAASSLVALDKQTSSEDLRLFHQIAKCFEDFEWVSALMDRMDDNGRQAMLDRIRAIDNAWQPAVKRKLVKDILAKYPDLALPQPTAVETPAETQRFTSWHSYNAYRETLRKLVEEDLPKNARDIDVARSYGDLRENFEYQTAKDTQRMLLQRQADLSEQIASVKGTDFADVPADKVAMGTEVVLRFEDGSQKTFAVLGEWDHDETLGILPCRSRIAEAVLGCSAGTQVTLPSTAPGDAPRNATIEAVNPLSDAVRTWIRG